MSLVTRCTLCGTTFRVTPVQLSARGGRVRCGKCSAAFDGVASLLTQEAISVLPDAPSPQMGLFEAHASTAVPLDTGEIAAADIAAPLAHLPESEVPADVTAGFETTAKAPPAALSEPLEPAVAPGIPPQPVPAFMQRRPRTAYVLVWSLLALIALAGLAGQAALHFRTEIAVLLPQARIYMETACEMLGCEVRLPRRADLMSIESSDLQADTQRPGVIVLNALLRNRAAFRQEYPDLELTLTDERDQPVIRRVLKPGDYLQDKRFAIVQGVGAGAEEAVRIYLDASPLRATGYRLYLFYR